MRNLRLTVCLVTATTLAAAIYEASTFASLQWRSIGPLRGGRSITCAGSPSRPYEYYFGATGGGLWKTTDGGTTWRPVTDGQLHSSSVGAVAVFLQVADLERVHYYFYRLHYSSAGVGFAPRVRLQSSLPG